MLLFTHNRLGQDYHKLRYNHTIGNIETLDEVMAKHIARFWSTRQISLSLAIQSDHQKH